MLCSYSFVEVDQTSVGDRIMLSCWETTLSTFHGSPYKAQLLDFYITIDLLTSKLSYSKVTRFESMAYILT